MLEFAIDDDLDSPPECPECHGVFVRCSLEITEGMAACRYCGARFRLAPAGGDWSPPEGLTMRGAGAEWKVETRIRSRQMTLLQYALGAGLLGLVFLAAHSGRLAGSRLIIPAWYAGLVVFALAQASVNYLWGRTSISARGTSGVVQTGIGPWGRRQTFLFPAINGVRLTLSTEDGAQGKDGARHVVRMEGVGFYVDFGEEFTEKQRMFMALTVLKWIVATRQNA